MAIETTVRVRRHVVVHGMVQGVGFRSFVREAAEERDLAGWVRNNPDGSVELEAEGSRGQVEEFLNTVRYGHPYAQVTDLTAETVEAAGGESEGFEIIY